MPAFNCFTHGTFNLTQSGLTRFDFNKGDAGYGPFGQSFKTDVINRLADKPRFRRISRKSGKKSRHLLGQLSAKHCTGTFDRILALIPQHPVKSPLRPEPAESSSNPDAKKEKQKGQYCTPRQDGVQGTNVLHHVYSRV